MINKRKKNTRQKGSKTHGWGSMKKHRGKGNKGGAGMAGTGKRGDANKPSIWHKKYFGKHGFTRKRKRVIVNTINLKEIEQKLESWINSKKISKEGDAYKIDLKALGFDKLLSEGKLSSKLNIEVDQASKKAVEKVSGAGGSVSVKKQAK